MASFQQVNYCKNCKTYVSVNEKGQCKKCKSTSINKSWSVRFRIICLDGEKQKRLSGFKTKKEADIAYSQYISSYSLSNETKNNTSFIFEELLKKYLINCNINNAGSTVYDKNKTFELHILPYFKGKDVSKLRKIDLLDWQNILWKATNPKTKQEYSWKYRTKIRDFMFNFLSYCEEFYNIPNQFRSIRKPKNQDIKEDIVFWQIDEFNKFINTVNDLEWKTLWMTFMFTGARFNEIRALSDNDVDTLTIINKALSGKKVASTIKATKNYKSVKKQSPEILRQIIQEYKTYKLANNISPKFLFGGQQPLSEKIIRRQLDKDIMNFNKLNPMNTLSRITPHGFRHSYVSLLIDSGVSTKIIAELIGDREEQVIKTYGHLYKNAKDNAIEKLNKNLGLL